MTRKFFPLDKNYLLKEAQQAQQDSLLVSLIQKSKEQYERLHNPLQLADAFSERIRSYRPGNLKPLYTFYETLAAVYRFKYGNNQLEFLWDGQGHQDKYLSEWKETFEKWSQELLARENFVQAVLDLTVFLPENRHAHLAENRMTFALLQFVATKDGFPELKYHKTKGVVEMVA